MPTNILRVGVKRTGPDSFQWCPAPEQGATGTNWSRAHSGWRWGRTSSLWGWWSTGTGCPGRLWIVLLWRYSRPAWKSCSVACCRWPSFGRRFGLDDPQRSLPTPNILWFCDSVIYGNWNCICFMSVLSITQHFKGQLPLTSIQVWVLSTSTNITIRSQTGQPFTDHLLATRKWLFQWQSTAMTETAAIIHITKQTNFLANI